LAENDKAIETFKKVTRINPKDHQAFVELCELLVESDWAAAMEYLKTSRTLLKTSEKIPVDCSMELGFFILKRQSLSWLNKVFKEALGDGI
jgi:RNA polymerase-associated protein CTR9